MITLNEIATLILNTYLVNRWDVKNNILRLYDLDDNLVCLKAQDDMIMCSSSHYLDSIVYYENLDEFLKAFKSWFPMLDRVEQLRLRF